MLYKHFQSLLKASVEGHIYQQEKKLTKVFQVTKDIWVEGLGFLLFSLRWFSYYFFFIKNIYWGIKHEKEQLHQPQSNKSINKNIQNIASHD